MSRPPAPPLHPKEECPEPELTNVPDLGVPALTQPDDLTQAPLDVENPLDLDIGHQLFSAIDAMDPGKDVISGPQDSAVGHAAVAPLASSTPIRDELLETLKQYFGYSEFHRFQLQAMYVHVYTYHSEFVSLKGLA